MTSRAAPGRLRVGTDLVYVPEVQSSIEHFGDRYTRRVYTTRELATCASSAGLSAPRLAARFAAKEAVIKVLRPTGGMSYRDIEVVLDVDGAPAIAFSGAARDRAHALGLDGGSVSISHDGDYAMAV
ncbi:MAG: holo-ACP synthase, partial [Ilumatobacteraceae bacterium]